MEWKLNSQEYDAMFDLDHEDRIVYMMGIRPYMDYGTGIVGIKRRFSYQSLSELLEVPSSSGKKFKKHTKRQIRYILERLEKSGLITRIEDSWFKIKLNYASVNESNSERFVRGSSGFASTGRSDKNQEKIINNQVSYVEQDVEVGTEVRPQKFSRCVTPQVSGNNINNNINIGGAKRASRSPSNPLPTDFQIKDSHKKLATELSMDDAWLNLEFGNFCDHFWENQKKGKNWDLAFNRWIRRSKSYNPNKTKQGASNGKSGKRDWYFDNIAEKVRAAGY